MSNKKKNTKRLSVFLRALSEPAPYPHICNWFLRFVTGFLDSSQPTLFVVSKIRHWFLRFVTTHFVCGFCEDVRGVGCPHICHSISSWFILLTSDTLLAILRCPVPSILFVKHFTILNHLSFSLSLPVSKQRGWAPSHTLMPLT